MADDTYRMLYVDKTNLALHDVDELTQASVLFADHCLVRASARADPTLGDAERLLIEDRLDFLHKIGAVKFWSVEGEEDWLGAAGIDMAHKPDNRVAKSTYAHLYETVTERILKERNKLLKAKGGDEVDAVTEAVLGRNQLWKFALSSALKADRLLAGETSAGTFLHSLSSPVLKYATHEQPVIKGVLHELKIANVSVLTDYDIRQCRKYLPAFRKQVTKELNEHDPAAIAPSVVSGISKKIAEEYKDELMAIGRKHVKQAGPTAILREASWDAAGFVFDKVLGAKYAKILLEWKEERSRASAFRFLYTLDAAGRGELNRFSRYF